jgi:FkbM family methyltransferase
MKSFNQSLKPRQSKWNVTNLNTNELFRWINNRLDEYFSLRIQPSSKARLSRCRTNLFRERRIDCVFDVGANQGQFGQQIRNDGYTGRIISFEPTTAVAKLNDVISNDASWKAFNVALSDFEGLQEMFLSSNDLLSSSLLRPTEILNHLPVDFVGKAMVQVERLDSYLDDLGSENYLKLDVQGSELRVLKGAHKAIERFQVVEFESAIIPLYEAEADFWEICDFLKQANFDSVLMVPTHWDARGRLISLDSIFVRVDQ